MPPKTSSRAKKTDTEPEVEEMATSTEGTRASGRKRKASALAEEAAETVTLMAKKAPARVTKTTKAKAAPKESAKKAPKKKGASKKTAEVAASPPAPKRSRARKPIEEAADDEEEEVKPPPEKKSGRAKKAAKEEETGEESEDAVEAKPVKGKGRKAAAAKEEESGDGEDEEEASTKTKKKGAAKDKSSKAAKSKPKSKDLLPGMIKQTSVSEGEMSELLSMKNDDIKQLLKKNGVKVKGNKDELQQRLKFCLEYGCLPTCPKCFGGKMDHSGSGVFKCKGFFDDDEYIACRHSAKGSELEFRPFFVN